jgi:hypothetical protein
MTKPIRYRLSFDFRTPEAMRDFWESFVAISLVPDPDASYSEGDFRTCELVHHDSMHDRNVRVKTVLVREKAKHAGNGRPVVFVDPKIDSPAPVKIAP